MTDGPAIAAEVVRAVEKEWAVTLADFLLRRSCVGLRADQALGGVKRVAEVMGRVCGWDTARRAEEVERYRGEVGPMRRFSTEGSDRRRG